MKSNPKGTTGRIGHAFDNAENRGTRMVTLYRGMERNTQEMLGVGVGVLKQGEAGTLSAEELGVTIFTRAEKLGITLALEAAILKLTGGNRAQRRAKRR